MIDKTIVYYTSSREDPNFEAKIIANTLRQKGDLPVISVSQKPIDFGTNICVGEVGHSYLNEYRQMLIGAKAAKTPYVALTESDFLYPEMYFNFKPSGANLYRYNNVWIVYKNPKIYSYRRKPFSEGAQICKREYLIELLENYLGGGPEWYDGEIQVKDKSGRPKRDTFRVPFEPFGGEVACISFKTGEGMRMYTYTMRGRVNIKMNLPYWGNVGNLRKEYL